MDAVTSVEFDVVACRCDDSGQCITRPVRANSAAQICIYAPSPELVVDGVLTLVLAQTRADGNGISRTPIYNGVPDSLTTVDAVDGSGVVKINTRMTTAFFVGLDAESPEPIEGSGTVRLVFQDGSRRLVKLTLHDQEENSRFLQGDDALSTEFKFEIAVEPSSSDNGGISNGLIVGTVVGVALATTIMVVFVFKRRFRRKEVSIESAETGKEDTEKM